MLSGGLDSSFDRRTHGSKHDGAAQDVLRRLPRGPVAGSSRTPATVAAASGPTTPSSSSRSRSDAISLDEIVWHLDEPLADLSTIGFHALCQLAAEQVTVALSGQGADELLAGYRKHVAAWGVDRASRCCPVRSAGAAKLATRAGTDGSREDCADDRCRRSGGAAARHRARTSTPTVRRTPLHGASSLRSTAMLPDGRSRRDSTALRGRAVDTTLYLDGQLAPPRSECCTTSTAPRWRTRSRSVCPSSTTELVELCARIPPLSRSGGRRPKIVLPLGCPRPRSRRHHRQAEDRFLRRHCRRVAAHPAREPGDGRVRSAPAGRGRPDRRDSSPGAGLELRRAASGGSAGAAAARPRDAETWMETFLPRAFARAATLP